MSPKKREKYGLIINQLTSLFPFFLANSRRKGKGNKIAVTILLSFPSLLLFCFLWKQEGRRGSPAITVVTPKSSSL
jgi:hypothetical protein